MREGGLAIQTKHRYGSESKIVRIGDDNVIHHKHLNEGRIGRSDKEDFRNLTLKEIMRWKNV